MGCHRKGIPIHGWLVIDKPSGITSNAVVRRVRRLTGAAKIGHGGTLDPLATGILPLAFGEATKVISFVMHDTKTYRFVIRWGEERSTDDAEGVIVTTSDVRPTKDDINRALNAFIGDIDQLPPKYSAVKINGKRAYALARSDQEVILKSRTVHIQHFVLLSLNDANHATFEVVCGKGTYMRSLARDLARALGTVGHISMLRRTAVGNFTEKNAILLDNTEALRHSDALDNYLLPLETVLDDIPAVDLTGLEAEKMRNGQPVSFLAIAQQVPLRTFSQHDIVCVTAGSKPVALARIEESKICPVRVLNL